MNSKKGFWEKVFDVIGMVDNFFNYIAIIIFGSLAVGLTIYFAFFR